MNNTASLIRATLQKHYPVQEAAALSRIVCCEMFGQSAVDYYLGKDMGLSLNDEEKLQGILARLCNFEPIQYIQGFARFLGRDFLVSPGVLIPRQETEELVEYVLKETPPDASILDVGTGSGCIAVTLSKKLPEAKVEAWDISEEALRVARKNNELLGASVCFSRCDVLSCRVQEEERLDAIVSNPPYVTESEKAEMERNVLDWEPETALFVPDSDPLLFYRRIGEIGMAMLKKGGKLYFEINRAYGKNLADMLSLQGYVDVRIVRDLSNNDRIVSAQRVV